MAGDAHRFRFFVDVPGASGTVVTLSVADAEHVRVLRLTDGDRIEAVDVDGRIWNGELVGASEVRLTDIVAEARAAREIELVTGALTGNRFDELVDGATQAGATSIVPLITNARDRDRLTQRRERLQRLAVAAAKQSKQARIATVTDPIDEDALLQRGPGIVFDASATESLLDIELPSSEIRIVIGPADGLDPVLVSRLVDAGWRLAKLGSSILRAELAAPVATAIVAMRLDAELAQDVSP